MITEGLVAVECISVFWALVRWCRAYQKDELKSGSYGTTDGEAATGYFLLYLFVGAMPFISIPYLCAELLNEHEAKEKRRLLAEQQAAEKRQKELDSVEADVQKLLREK